MWPPLHAAAYNADVDTVRRLLDEGTPPDARDERGYTALLWASLRAAVADQVPVIEALLGVGADPSAVTAAGDSTCLMLAVQSGNAASVAALLAGGANIDGQADGITALMVGARHGEMQICKILLQAGADPTIHCGRFCASDYARYGGHDELANMIDSAALMQQLGAAAPSSS
jgi:ankyrin repeat protein